MDQRFYYAKHFGQHGSAKFIGGKTVIVAIFADDRTCSWSYPLSGKQLTLYNKICSRFKIGLEWLEKQVASYNVSADFVWDFSFDQSEYSLCYKAGIDEKLTAMDNRRNVYQAIRSFILENVDSAKLMVHYKADNIVYAVFLNAPSGEDYRSYCLPANYTSLSEGQVFYETAVFVPYGRGRENTPAVYAHEILHCFGAEDLYHASDYVPQAYVDYLARNKVRELMNACYFSKYDRVTTSFSKVDAYFVGLLDTCDAVKKFGLGPNIYHRF